VSECKYEVHTGTSIATTSPTDVYVRDLFIGSIRPCSNLEASHELEVMQVEG